MKQALLALMTGYSFPGVCKQLTLSFVGKFLPTAVPSNLSWARSGNLALCTQNNASFCPAGAFRASAAIVPRHTRAILQDMLNKKLMAVASGSLRYRLYRLN